uniref:Uncharacterized protein n=1 Tax=Micrurus lemniscatus lemniscatus TaxID=129467 RepID=A0A2D4IXM1_MICLE
MSTQRLSLPISWTTTPSFPCHHCPTAKLCQVIRHCKRWSNGLVYLIRPCSRQIEEVDFTSWQIEEVGFNFQNSPASHGFQELTLLHLKTPSCKKTMKSFPA